MHRPQPSTDSGVGQCILCGSPAEELRTGDGALYFSCRRCSLIHLDPARRLAPTAERARYDLHQNDPNDPDYVRFLHRLADPVIQRLRPGAHGLDFGSGPSPVLALLLTSAGFPCEAYDPFFAADGSLLRRRYDYVTCCEVVEHLHDPAKIFTTLRALLAPGALLGVMTRFHQGVEAFEGWWYRRDPTHVCFYDDTTMRWIAQRHGLNVGFPGPDVALFSASV